MKQFKRKATLEELRANCAKRGWTLQTDELKTGSDFVSFKFKVGRVSGTALVNTVNGCIIGELANGKFFSDHTTKYDSRQWFKELLKVAYVS